MEENNPSAGGEYDEALSILRTIIQEQRYEDFYNGLEVYLQVRDESRADGRKYINENVVLPCVMNYVIGRRLHGDKLVASWQGFFKANMSGISWEENILDSMTKGADAFAVAVKAIKKSIDDFVNLKGYAS
ncbi:MAG: hypothetical protein ACLPN1_02360 [Dissulfurispiraceae bacterium]